MVVFSKATLPVAEPIGKTARREAAAEESQVAEETPVAEEATGRRARRGRGDRPRTVEAEDIEPDDVPVTDEEETS